mgnify:CR=1 FL=1
MSRRRSSRSGNTIETEVNRLFRQGDAVDTTTLLSLKNKYGEWIVYEPELNQNTLL